MERANLILRVVPIAVTPKILNKANREIVLSKSYAKGRVLDLCIVPIEWGSLLFHEAWESCRVLWSQNK